MKLTFFKSLKHCWIKIPMHTHEHIRTSHTHVCDLYIHIHIHIQKYILNDPHSPTHNTRKYLETYTPRFASIHVLAQLCALVHVSGTLMPRAVKCPFTRLFCICGSFVADDFPIHPRTSVCVCARIIIFVQTCIDAYHPCIIHV